MKQRRNLVLVAVISMLAAAACICTGGGFDGLDGLEGFEDFEDFEDFENFGDSDFNDFNTTTSNAEIQVGTTGTGTITSLTDAHNWTFQGTAGQTIIIETIGIGDTDPDVTLYDPNLNEVASNDDFDGFNSYIETTLPVDGTYTARVEVWSTGDYQITVR